MAFCLGGKEIANHQQEQDGMILVAVEHISKDILALQWLILILLQPFREALARTKLEFCNARSVDPPRLLASG